MTNSADEPSDTDPTRPDLGWNDAAADEQHPGSVFPGAGERVDDEDRQAALDTMIEGSDESEI